MEREIFRVCWFFRVFGIIWRGFFFFGVKLDRGFWDIGFFLGWDEIFWYKYIYTYIYVYSF